MNRYYYALAWFVLAWLFPHAARAGEVVEKFDNGNVRVRYTTDADGEKSGSYLEYFESGPIKIRANYISGKLNGKYEERFEDGKIRIRAGYRDGEFNGLYEEYAPADDKSRLLKAFNYRDGKLHGEYRETIEDGRQLHQFYSNGTLLLPKSQRQTDATLAQIAKTPIETEGKKDGYGYAKALQNVTDRNRHAEREQAVRLLMQYRYLCGVPYEGISLDYTMTVEAVAAADVCERLGTITHNPTNPGMPEADFLIAKKGCASSNLAMGQGVVGAVHMFMHDSDKSNIDRVGHRRWCLNPQMQKTGFGAMGKFSAMYSFDGSRADVPDYEMVAYPPRGYLPRSFFSPTHAWSVQPNPRKFEINDDTLKVQVFPARLSLRSGDVSLAAQPLSLNYSNVARGGFGAGPAIIFRPDGVQTAKGSTYAVVIKGIKETSGEDYLLKYLTIFY